MMSRIMGRDDADALERAGHLGIGMQLTNIARDVGEDARRGRVYLPATWLAEANGTVDDVLALRPTPPVRAVTRRLLAFAGGYYTSGIGGVALLPASCRPAILTAALLYRAIGDRVLAHGGDGITTRARVGAARKVGLIAIAGARCAFDPRLRSPAGAAP
jgi:phytoene synthase